jgi:D-alanine-D-alanine ligase
MRVATVSAKHAGYRDVRLDPTRRAAGWLPHRLQTSSGDPELLWPDGEPLVWVLIPHSQDAQGRLTSGYDTPKTRAALATAFNALGLRWIWQPITASEQEAVIERIAFASRRTPGVVVNLCDGCDEAESDGYPGSSVVELLEAKALPFTGAGLDFYRLSTSKIAMKQAFAQACVPTPPYACVSDPQRDITGMCARLGVPLIVKPAVSAGCLGLSLESVVQTDAEIRRQVEALLAGRHSLLCRPGAILIERFVNGPEFTVLIVGSSRPGHIRRIYPPLERAFSSELSELERILLPAEECSQPEPISDQIGQRPPERVAYRLASAALVNPLCDLSGRAYRALGGTGYARVDIRMDQATGELLVLEVNANCEISPDPDETATGLILYLTGASFVGLMREIICGAYDRGP